MFPPDSDPNRPGAFDDEFRALEQEHDRLADLLVGDGDHVVENVVEDRRGELARLLDRDSVGDRVSVAPDFDADDADPRLHRPQRQRDAGCEPAAAYGHQHRLRLRNLFSELEPDRALTGDHRLVFVGMDEGRTGFLRVRERSSQRLLEGQPGQLGVCRVVAAGLHFRHRRVLRDEDRCGDPSLASRPRNGLAVVAGARGDDAGGTLRFG